MTSENMPAREEKIEHAKACIDRFTEATKGRLALWTFLALAMITLTGFAVQNKRPELLYLAAIVPAFALFVDLVIKYLYAAPYLYKATRLEFELYGQDATSLLFLSLGKANSKFHRVLE